MSTNLITPNPEFIPDIQSDLFVGHEQSRFAVGIVAVGVNAMPGRESEYHGYGLLRGNVYAYEQQYMPVADLNEDGTESDMDDLRSIHFAVIENAIRSPRVVGTMRLIIKSREDNWPLPIEDHYPEAFADGDVPILSTEVSRWICRHEDRKIQSNLRWPLFTAGVNAINDNNLGPVFGAVKENLARGLNISGVPVTNLIPKAKFIPEFNAEKLPIRVEINELTQRLEDDRPELTEAIRAASANAEFTYSGTVTPVSSPTVPAA
jgi:hypothetical protein